MSEELEGIETPPDDAVVWRYMSLGKLVDVVLQRAAYFCRVDQLGDPLEGSWPEPNVAARRDWFKRHGHDFTDADHDRISQFMAEQRRQAAVWCWHANAHETATMWRAYLGDGEGVAVQTTARRLRESLAGAGVAVQFGMARYVNHAEDFVPHPGGINVMVPLFLKQRTYSDEREVRAMVWYQREAGVSEAERAAPGIRVPVDTGALLERVVVRPAWLLESVRALLAAGGLSAEVKVSELLRAPRY